MSKRDELAAVVRGATKVGPFGPNALEILGRGGKVHLTGAEADALADAVLAWLGEQFDEGLRAKVAESLWREARAGSLRFPTAPHAVTAIVRAHLGLDGAAQDAQDGAVGPGSVPMGTGEGAAPNGAQIEDFEGER